MAQPDALNILLSTFWIDSALKWIVTFFGLDHTISYCGFGSLFWSELNLGFKGKKKINSTIKMFFFLFLRYSYTSRIVKFTAGLYLARVKGSLPSEKVIVVLAYQTVLYLYLI